VYSARPGPKITGHPAERSGPSKVTAVLERLPLPASSLSSRLWGGKDALPQHTKRTTGDWKTQPMIRSEKDLTFSGTGEDNMLKKNQEQAKSLYSFIHTKYLFPHIIVA